MGTTPAVHPLGERTTTLQVLCARSGSANVRVAWSEGSLVQIRGPVETTLAPTPLRRGAGAGLVAWSPVFHRTLAVQGATDPDGTVVGLVLHGTGGGVTAARRL